MSNKSRLQTNNTNLQTLIDKANALPDAGSGSGSGAVTMCTGTILVDGPIMDDITVWSLDENLNVKTTTLSWSVGGTFTAARGTIFAIKPWGGSDFTGCTECYSSYVGGAYIVNDDNFTLTYLG